MLAISEHGDNLDAARVLFSEEYKIPNFRSSPSEQKFVWGHTILGDDVMTFRTSIFKGNLAGLPEPTNDVIVWWNKSGRSLIGTGRRLQQVLTESPQVLSRQHPTAVQHFDVTHNLVHLNHRFVDRVAQELAGESAGGVSFESGPALSSPAASSWRSAVNRVAALWLPDPTALSDILRYELARYLSVSLLTNFASSALEPTMPSGMLPGQPLGGVEPGKVSLAIDFAYDNAHRPIGATELAEVAGLSSRALQLALRRQLGQTPTELLRHIRLERVHWELRYANVNPVPVAEAARRWGFAHLGRFAGLYFEKYGELPSHTRSAAGS